MKLIYLSSLLVMQLFSGNAPTTPVQITIQGVVVGEDQQPVGKAYLFIVKGEEETISGQNGKFALTTWQKFPMALTIEHPSYKKQQIVIRDAAAKQVIRLGSK